MTTRFVRVTLALPADLAPEAVPQTAVHLIAACWPGMSRAQLLDRERRLTLRASLRRLAGLMLDGCSRFALRLALPDPAEAAVAVIVLATEDAIELTAHVRRNARHLADARRAKVSLPSARDVRQMGLF
jgi:hypothetical protein